MAVTVLPSPPFLRMIYHDQPKQWEIPPPKPKGAEKFSRFPNSSRRRAGVGALGWLASAAWPQSAPILRLLSGGLVGGGAFLTLNALFRIEQTAAMLRKGHARLRRGKLASSAG